MKDATKHVETSKAAWKAKFPGIFYIPLRTDGEEKMGTFVFKMEPKATYPKHRHPEGEEIFMLKGQLVVGETTLKPGDYHYAASGSIHTMHSPEGCMFVLICNKPLLVIPERDHDSLDEPTAITSLDVGPQIASVVQAQEVDYNTRDLTPEGDAASLDIEAPNTVLRPKPS